MQPRVGYSRDFPRKNFASSNKPKIKEAVDLKRDLENLVLQMHAAGVGYNDAVREFKKRYILEVMARHRGNQCKAAEELGMHRNTLSRTLTELGLDSAQIRQGMRRPPRSVRPSRPGLQIVSSGR
jgi:DNA-binding NtrC family response regulator